eukprot:3480611-Prymnesium_polylepis.2
MPVPKPMTGMATRPPATLGRTTHARIRCSSSPAAADAHSRAGCVRARAGRGGAGSQRSVVSRQSRVSSERTCAPCGPSAMMSAAPGVRSAPLPSSLASANATSLRILLDASSADAAAPALSPMAQRRLRRA